MNYNIFCWGGEKGNGELTTELRSIDSFSGINVSGGIPIQLIKSEETKANVTIDSNLQDFLSTEIEDGILKIKFTKSICETGDVSIDVYYNNLNEISSSSGATITSSDTLFANSIELRSSSGAEIDLTIMADTLDGTSSSGSHMELAGLSAFTAFNVSSGAEIEGASLATEYGEINGSSGGFASVTGNRSLDLSASSGAQISYKTDSARIQKNTSSGGSIDLID